MEKSVRVYNEEEFLGTADVSEDGRWSFRVEGLSVRNYAFRAETSDGKVESNTWAVTVQQPPLYEDFESGPGGMIGNNESMEFPTMTATNFFLGGVPLSISVAAGFDTPPMITGRAINISGGAVTNGYLKLTLARGASAVKFGIRSERRMRPHVYCYNEKGMGICSGLTPEYGSAIAVWAEFSPLPPYNHELIKSVNFSENILGVSIDNFTLFF